MSGDNKTEIQDCAVCLQKCNHPTQLPCGHVFCFLCVKGVAIQNKKCAMCRAEIPPDYLDHPVLLEKVQPAPPDVEGTEGYQWYYEGRNGWWKYDERSNIELELAFNGGDRHCKLLLAGALYVIDFQNMVQVRSRDPTRRRRVRRDMPTLPAKGIAGIKIIDNCRQTATKSESEENNASSHNASAESDVELIESEEEIINIADDSESSQDNFSASLGDNILGEVVQRISSMNLQAQIEDRASRHSPEGT